MKFWCFVLAVYQIHFTKKIFYHLCDFAFGVQLCCCLSCSVVSVYPSLVTYRVKSALSYILLRSMVVDLCIQIVNKSQYLLYHKMYICWEQDCKGHQKLHSWLLTYHLQFLLPQSFFRNVGNRWGGIAVQCSVVCGQWQGMYV